MPPSADSPRGTESSRLSGAAAPVSAVVAASLTGPVSGIRSIASWIFQQVGDRKQDMAPPRRAEAHGRGHMPASLWSWRRGHSPSPAARHKTWLSAPERSTEALQPFDQHVAAFLVNCAASASPSCWGADGRIAAC